jgi:hypothetical protein
MWRQGDITEKQVRLLEPYWLRIAQHLPDEHLAPEYAPALSELKCGEAANYISRLIYSGDVVLVRVAYGVCIDAG